MNEAKPSKAKPLRLSFFFSSHSSSLLPLCCLAKPRPPLRLHHGTTSCITSPRTTSIRRRPPNFTDGILFLEATSAASRPTPLHRPQDHYHVLHYRRPPLQQQHHRHHDPTPLSMGGKDCSEKEIERRAGLPKMSFPGMSHTHIHRTHPPPLPPLLSLVSHYGSPQFEALVCGVSQTLVDAGARVERANARGHTHNDDGRRRRLTDGDVL